MAKRRRMAKSRRVAKPLKTRRVALYKPRTVARSNRRKARLVIGTHKFAVKVTCAGKIHMTRSGKKAYNAQKRKLKVRCAKPKRVGGVPTSWTKRGSKHTATQRHTAVRRKSLYDLDWF